MTDKSKTIKAIKRTKEALASERSSLKVNRDLAAAYSATPEKYSDALDYLAAKAVAIEIEIKRLEDKLAKLRASLKA